MFVALLLLGCSAGSSTPEPTPDFAARVDSLRRCPTGDQPWREVLAAAADEEHLEKLFALTQELAREYPERWELPWTAGQCLFRLERAEDSRGHSQAALVLARRAADPSGIASSANDLGWLAQLGGELAAGQALYDEALAAARRASRVDLETFVHSNLAGLLLQAGEYAGSLRHLELAEQGLQSMGRPDAARSFRHNRGIFLIQLGDAVRAREVLEQVRQEAVEAEDLETWSDAAIQLGRLHLALDDPTTARQFYEQVATDHPTSKLQAEMGLGWVALREGDFAAAARILGQAAASAAARDRLLASTIEIHLAEAEMRNGDVSLARTRLERVIAERAGDAEDTANFARQILGKVLLRSERFAEAARVLEQVVRFSESQREPLENLGVGMYSLRERADSYADLAYALTQGKTAGRHVESSVLRLANQAQARTLRRGLVPGQAVPQGADLGTIQRGLAPTELLLNYLIGDDHGLLLAISRREARVVVVDGRRLLLEPLRDYRIALRRRVALSVTARAAGLRLRERLLDPVQDLLAEAQRVYVVPDRELALLPFSALPLQAGDEATSAGPRYLGEELEIAVLPMAGVPSRGAGSAAPILLAGPPRLDPAAGFRELPWSAFEISRLQRLWGAEHSTVLGGEELTLAAIRSLQLSDFRTVHLATHAVASTLNPQHCGVILSDGERLGLEDIAALDLGSTLVVLSACQTGEGELVPGEGVVGLGWGFLRAGADAVVASLWTVDDVATARLMVSFHEQLQGGVEPVRALAAARRALAEEYRHPVYWAPFVVVLRPELRPAG